MRVLLAWACACVLSLPPAWGADGKGSPRAPRSPSVPSSPRVSPPVTIPNIQVPLTPAALSGSVDAALPAAPVSPSAQAQLPLLSPPAQPLSEAARAAAPLALGANAIPKGAKDGALPRAAVTAQDQLKQAAPGEKFQAALEGAGGENATAEAGRAFDNAASQAGDGPAVSVAGTGPTWTASSPRLSPAPTRGPPASPSSKAPFLRAAETYSRQAAFSALLDEGVLRGDIPTEDREDWIKVAWLDPLTGVYNRRYLEDHKDALARSHSVLLDIKLDDLKEVNDAYDHEAGNDLLRAGAATASSVVGRDGVVIRRSPTSFQVFLDAPAEQAWLAAEALRAVVERTMGTVTSLLPGAPKVAPERPLAGTISVGIGSMQGPKPQPRYDGGLERSRQARADAKDKGGGNRVAIDPFILEEMRSNLANDNDSTAVPREALERALADATAGKQAAERSLRAQLLDSTVMPRQDLEAAVAALKKGKKAVIGHQAEETARQAPRETAEAQRRASAHRPVRDLLTRVKEYGLRRLLFEMVYLDRLTRLRTRRWLFEHLEEVLGPEGFRHYIALDIDHFGRINAKLGEEQADLVLAELGTLMHEFTRDKKGMALHLSGEEFVLLTKGTRREARAFSEEFRKTVEEELGRRVASRRGIVDPETGQPFTITVSMGIGTIRSDPGGAKPTLELVTAASEAMLQRAKAGGRNRVEGEELAGWLGRVFRLDVAARRAVTRVAIEGADKVFDNGVRRRAAVIEALGFNPAWTSGERLDDGQNAGSEVWAVTGPDGRKRVAKFAPEETLVNELAARAALEEFSFLQAGLSAPAAVGYRRFLLRPVMVMEHVERSRKDMDGRSIPTAHRALLAPLLIGLGVEDMNFNGFLSVDWKRTVVSDFQKAFLESRPNWRPDRQSNLSVLPYVTSAHLNDYADYALAVSKWRASWEGRTRERLRKRLSHLGLSLEETERRIQIVDENTRLMEDTLKSDIALANRLFTRNAADAGLDETQTKALSEINRSAMASPEGGILRDTVRLLGGRSPLLGPNSVTSPLHLHALELKTLAELRPRGLTAADKESLVRAARQGVLRDGAGRPYTPASAFSAAEKLDALLRGG